MPEATREIGVGLIGLGVVGTGVAQALIERSDYFARQTGARLVLRRAAVRDLGKDRGIDLPLGTLTTRVADLLEDPEIRIIVEVMGGEEPASTYIRGALDAGKHVVTANKELMAKFGPELLAEAHQRKLDIMFEASVGGGIPLIAPLRRDLLANRITAIRAIINGTTNYILTRMANDGTPYLEALREAQELGYAEPDPTNDVEGLDAAYKLAIMATLGIRAEVRPGDIHVEGISGLDVKDFGYAAKLGYVIKLVAIAERLPEGIRARVSPVLLPESAPLAKVDGVFNAVEIFGDLTDQVMFQGPGAGSAPTSSAVIADLLDLAHAMVLGVPERRYWGPDSATPVLDMDGLISRYYLRVKVPDQPGVLGQLAQTLGDQGVSIAAMNQQETHPDEHTAELVVMTHEAEERAMQAAITAFERLPIAVRVLAFLRVEG